jgi:nitroreductase
MNNRPWKFIVVTKPELLERLSMAKQSGSTILKNAPLGIVICADQTNSDVWIEDCSIAAIFIQLTAESLGLGSCWIQIRERMHSKLRFSEDHISEVLNIPEGIRVASIIAIGYPDENKSPHNVGDLLYENVHHNTYGTPFK